MLRLLDFFRVERQQIDRPNIFRLVLKGPFHSHNHLSHWFLPSTPAWTLKRVEYKELGTASWQEWYSRSKRVRENERHVTGTKEVPRVASTLLGAYKGGTETGMREHSQLLPVQTPGGRGETNTESALQPPWEALFTITCGCSPSCSAKHQRRLLVKALSPPQQPPTRLSEHGFEDRTSNDFCVRYISHPPSVERTC